MKYYLPNQNIGYLQTNRSDSLGSLWSTFNLDFQSNLGKLRLANKLVINTDSSDIATIGLPVAFDFFYGKYWAICGSKIFKNDSLVPTANFALDESPYSIGDGTSQFDVTNPSGTTFRYTYDGTGTDPVINATRFPTGATIVISGGTFNAGNKGTFTITGSGSNYFEVTNASGVAEADKIISTGYIMVYGSNVNFGFSTTQSDLCVFNDKLWASSATELRYKTLDVDGSPNISRWYYSDTFGSATMSHKLLYFKKHDRLYYISSDSLINSVDTSDTIADSGDYTFNPGKSVGYIYTMAVNSQYIWVGSITENTGDSAPTSKTKATISQWDGISSQATNEFTIDSAGILAMTVHDDVPYAIDTDGRILQYTGYSFKEIARFPIDKQILANSTAYNTQKPIHFNGFTGTKNNTLLILVNNLKEDAGSTINENFPSGIWELNLSNNSLTHKYSATLKAMDSSTVSDFGQNRVSAVGALKISPLQSDSTDGRSTLLAGMNIYTDATTIKSAIFIDSPYKPNTDNEGKKRGYFITTWFETTEVASNFKKIWAVFRKFTTDNGKLILKYRNTEEDPIEATITWVTTSQFTTTTDISEYLGYEVEILQGNGSGGCYTIIEITEDGGLYTVTIDEEIYDPTTNKARFQKWIKLLPEITGGFDSFGETTITDGIKTQIQIKGILEWTGDCEFTKLVLESDEQLKAKS